MDRLHSILAGVCLVTFGLAAPAAAQSGSGPQSGAGPDGQSARWHWGPLALEPKLLINNIGVDSNVFNTPTAPSKDFTISGGPQVDSWLRAGRAYFSGQTLVGFTYFHKAENQRSTDFGQKGRVEVRTVHITPHVAAGYLNSHQRLNAETDARVPRTGVDLTLGVLVPVGVRTSLDVEALRSTLRFDDDELVGTAFAHQLDRETNGATVKFNFLFSPLTTFVVRSEVRQDRFDAATERDSDSVAVLPGVEFTRDALLSGTAYVGFRSFTARHEEVPDFSGLVADVNLRFMARERLKVAFKVLRDVDYSVDPLTPYFVTTGGDVTVNQGIGGGWDIAGRAAYTRLGYRALRSLEGVDRLSREDNMRVLGTGLGRTLASGMRVGFDFDHAQRTSDVFSRRYSGFRAGGTVAYGF